MTRKSPQFLGTIICERCGSEALKTGAMQRYCRECSAIKDHERKIHWQSENRPPRDDHDRALAKERKSDARARGAATNAQEKQSIAWYEPPDLIWQVRIAVPFSYLWSKNAIYAMGKGGHLLLREETNTVRDELTLRIRETLTQTGTTIVRAKVWLDILVQKPDHRGDAVNVVDLVCDAVKRAIPIDDRWYAIRLLDWQVVKSEPMLYIGIGQETREEQNLCSYCGRILPLSAFTKNRRECRDCRRKGEQ